MNGNTKLKLILMLKLMLLLAEISDSYLFYTNYSHLNYANIKLTLLNFIKP